MTKKRRKRMIRKNKSTLQTLDISFDPDDTGVEVVAKFGLGKVMKTRFNKELTDEDIEAINNAFFLGYNYKDFKKEFPELSEVCTGWIKVRGIE